jgi:hypothetical protein
MMDNVQKMNYYICCITTNLVYTSVIIVLNATFLFLYLSCLQLLYYYIFRPHAAIFRHRYSYWNCSTVILLIHVWKTLLFSIKSVKVHKNPGNLLIALCPHWLFTVDVLFVTVVCGYHSLLSCSVQTYT